jgi:hypothetical protein
MFLDYLSDTKKSLNIMGMCMSNQSPQERNQTSHSRNSRQGKTSRSGKEKLASGLRRSQDSSNIDSLVAFPTSSTAMQQSIYRHNTSFESQKLDINNSKLKSFYSVSSSEESRNEKIVSPSIDSTFLGTKNNTSFSKLNALHVKALTNNLRHMKESATNRKLLELRRDSLNSIIATKGSAEDFSPKENTKLTENKQVYSRNNVEATKSKRWKSGSDFKITFSDQGAKYQSVQKWLNESIIDDKCINPIIPIPGSDVKHRTLPTVRRKDERLQQETDQEEIISLPISSSHTNRITNSDKVR